MNWTEVIQKLQAGGLSQAQIAGLCGTTQSTISDLARGESKEPRYSLGESLKALLRDQQDNQTQAA